MLQQQQELRRPGNSRVASGLHGTHCEFGSGLETPSDPFSRHHSSHQRVMSNLYSHRENQNQAIWRCAGDSSVVKTGVISHRGSAK